MNSDQERLEAIAAVARDCLESKYNSISAWYERMDLIYRLCSFSDEMLKANRDVFAQYDVDVNFVDAE